MMHLTELLFNQWLFIENNLCTIIVLHISNKLFRNMSTYKELLDAQQQAIALFVE